MQPAESMLGLSRRSVNKSHKSTQRMTKKGRESQRLLRGGYLYA